jgi:hypothetical protein
VTPSTHTYAFDTGYGGGMYLDGNDIDVYLDNVLFQNLKSVSRGAGIYAKNLDIIEIDGCKFEFMTTSEDGAAIYVKDLE